jgi:hypothetical protein
MNIKPFRIEHYYAKYEFSAKYMLSNSDAQSRTIGELLSLEPGAREVMDEHWLGYTEAPGAPFLRQAITRPSRAKMSWSSQVPKRAFSLPTTHWLVLAIT